MLNIFNCGYGMVLVTNREIYVGDKIDRASNIKNFLMLIY